MVHPQTQQTDSARLYRDASYLPGMQRGIRQPWHRRVLLKDETIERLSFDNGCANNQSGQSISVSTCIRLEMPFCKPFCSIS